MQTKKCVIDIETTSFFPWKGKLICIGIKNLQTNETTIFQNQNEKAQLEEFLNYFSQKKFDEIIGFNIGFDLRFLIAKCIQHQVFAQSLLDASSTDLMMLLKGFKRQYNFNKPGTLDEWTRCILGKGKTLSNQEIPILYRQDRLREIIDYNRNDVEITFELYEKITNVLGDNIQG